MPELIGAGRPQGQVAVVIVSWNTRDLLARAIASVVDEPQGRSVCVCVVDNASTDGSAAMVAERFPEVRLIEKAVNCGFGQANNLGFEASTEPYVLLLNSDAELQPGALGALLDELEQRPSVGAVGACLVNPDGSFQASYASFPSLFQELMLLGGLARRIWGPSFPSRPESASQVARSVDWVGAACMLLRREAIAATGGFDPAFHMYSEETDLCKRIHDAGFDIRYCPAALALHHGGRSTSQRSVEQPLLLWRSRLLFFEKHRPAWQVALLERMIRVTYRLRYSVWSLRASLSAAPADRRWRLRAEGAQKVLQGLA